MSVDALQGLPLTESLSALRSLYLEASLDIMVFGNSRGLRFWLVSDLQISEGAKMPYELVAEEPSCIARVVVCLKTIRTPLAPEVRP